MTIMVVRRVPRLVTLMMLVCGSAHTVLGAMAANLTCSGGGLALTPDLYHQGFAAYKDAACIPEEAFCYDEKMCPSASGSVFDGWAVVLNGMKQLRYIGANAFRSFKGNLTIHGSFPMLVDIKEFAFYNAGNTDSSFTLDGNAAAPAAPSLFHVGMHAFSGFSGTITIKGPFPSWYSVGVQTFEEAGNSKSVIALDCRNVANDPKKSVVLSTRIGVEGKWEPAFSSFNGDHVDAFESLDCAAIPATPVPSGWERKMATTTTTATTAATTATGHRTSSHFPSHSISCTGASKFECPLIHSISWSPKTHACMWSDDGVGVDLIQYYDGPGCVDTSYSLHCIHFHEEACGYAGECSWDPAHKQCFFYGDTTTATTTTTTSATPTTFFKRGKPDVKHLFSTNPTPTTTPRTTTPRTTTHPQTTSSSTSTDDVVVSVNTNAMSYGGIAVIASAFSLLAVVVLVAGSKVVRKSKRLSSRTAKRAGWAPATAETANAVYDEDDVPLLDLGLNVSDMIGELTQSEQPFYPAMPAASAGGMTSAAYLLMQHTRSVSPASYDVEPVDPRTKFAFLSSLDPTPYPEHYPQNHNAPIFADEKRFTLIPSNTLRCDFLETSSDGGYSTGLIQTSSSSESSTSEKQHIIKQESPQMSALPLLSASVLEEASVLVTGVGIAEWNSNVQQYPALRAHSGLCGMKSTHTANAKAPSPPRAKSKAPSPPRAKAKAPSPPRTIAACSFPLCTSKARSSERGLCTKHGARGACKTDGCTASAVTSGHCRTHRTNGTCSTPGCSTSVVSRGLCHKHGANGKCATPMCTNNALARGTCTKHGGRGLCAAQGCTASATARGCCKLHREKIACSVENCTTNAVKQGLCKKHGAYGTCSVHGCVTNAVRHGVCTKHGALGECSVQGCKNSAQARDLCTKHGAYGVCISDGCTTSALAGRKGHCKVHSA